MGRVPRRIWSTSRKITANVVPSLLCLPLGAAGVLLYRIEKPWAPLPLALLVACPLLLWIALNFLGLLGNEMMRGELARQLGRERGPLTEEVFFAGIARPKFTSALDPHEDVAFLILHPDALEVYGEQIKLSIPRGAITGIRRRPNVHSLVGLGGWVEVQYLSPDGPTALRIEPRVHHTLLKNQAERRQLQKKLEQWKAGSPDEGDPAAA